MSFKRCDLIHIARLTVYRIISLVEADATHAASIEVVAAT